MDDQMFQLTFALKQRRIHKISRAIYVVLLILVMYLSYSHIVLYSAIVNGILGSLFGFLAYGQHLCVEDWQRAVTDNARIISERSNKNSTEQTKKISNASEDPFYKN